MQGIQRWVSFLFWSNNVQFELRKRSNDMRTQQQVEAALKGYLALGLSKRYLAKKLNLSLTTIVVMTTDKNNTATQSTLQKASEGLDRLDFSFNELINK